MADGFEFGGSGRQAEGEPFERPVGTLQQVGEEIGGDIEGERGHAHTVLDRGFDQFGGEAGLGENDPHRGHSRGSRAQMKGESVTRRLAGEGLRDDGAGMPVDGAEVGGTVEGDIVGRNGRWCLGLNPVEIVGGLRAKRPVCRAWATGPRPTCSVSVTARRSVRPSQLMRVVAMSGS